MRRRLSVVVSSIGLLAILAQPIIAAGRPQVDCARDPEALSTAVTAAGPGARLVISGTCTGFLLLDKDLSIVGATSDAILVGDIGQGVLAVSSTAAVSITHLTIDSVSDFPGVVQVSNDGMLALRDVTITHGAIDAIRNTGTLTLFRSTVAENFGKGDGPIVNDGGSVTLRQSRISDNVNTELQGAIVNGVGGTFRVIDSFVSGNRGRDVIRNDGTMSIVKSEVTDNIGILPRGSLRNTGTLFIRGSLIRGNQGTDGGGIYNGGKMTLRGSSVVGNTAINDGGGIYNALDGTADVFRTIIEGNGAGLDGGGIFNEGALTLQRVTLLDNTPNDCAGC